MDDKKNTFARILMHIEYIQGMSYNRLCNGYVMNLFKFFLRVIDSHNSQGGSNHNDRLENTGKRRNGEEGKEFQTVRCKRG